MIEAPMTSGTPYTHINVTYTHVLRGCGKVLADQLNFHDGEERRVITARHTTTKEAETG